MESFGFFSMMLSHFLVRRNVRLPINRDFMRSSGSVSWILMRSDNLMAASSYSSVTDSRLIMPLVYSHYQITESVAYSSFVASFLNYRCSKRERRRSRHGEEANGTARIAFPHV